MSMESIGAGFANASVLKLTFFFQTPPHGHIHPVVMLVKLQVAG
jgi:hypothetical protein